MLEKTALVRLEGKEYHLTKVFVSDLKAQEAFWSRYFTMATRVLPNRQIKECRKAAKYEECNSISQAQH